MLKKKLIWPLVIIGLGVGTWLVERVVNPQSFLNKQLSSGPIAEVKNTLLEPKTVPNKDENSNNKDENIVTTLKPSDRIGSQVHIRTGDILTISAQEITVKVPKLAGEGYEVITALVDKNTPVIEVQIPTSIPLEQLEAVKRGAEIINRVPVKLDKLKVGQEVSVLSRDDMSVTLIVRTARIEYKFFLAS